MTHLSEHVSLCCHSACDFISPPSSLTKIVHQIITSTFPYYLLFGLWVLGILQEVSKTSYHTVVKVVLIPEFILGL